jgi:WD40 repeat protein
MKTMNTSLLCCLLTSLAVSFGGAAPLTNPPPENVPASIQRLQDQLEAQTKRLDRLYRLLGPSLEELEERAAASEKQQQEDKALTLGEVATVVDQDLSSLGCANPVVAGFAVITRDGALRIFDAAGKVSREFHQPGQQCTCLAFSPNGAELLAGTESGALLVWDTARGNCAMVCTNVGKKVDRVSWLGNDRLAWGSMMEYWKDSKASGQDKPAGAVLARDAGRQLWTFRGFVRNDFFTLAGSPDGRRLAVMEIPGLPRGGFVLDGATGEVIHTCYDKDHGSGPLSVGLSPDGNTLVIGYAPYDVILWDARTGEKRKLLAGHSNWVVSLAFSADSKLLISGAGDSTARIWDLDAGKEIGRIRFPGESSYVDSVGLSPKGDLAFALVRGMLTVRQVASRAPGK